ncbi:hypothetical protein MEQU1_000256 [Malassezia equina]|uniref:Alpha/beta hydrolase family protein n=1 Tax=Malassezia equina TaxID=1381935 RepID=A0AAF0EF74_9BASI|nr:hypothetical protein MEQU1_000256 [Malassezia equina]
MGAVLRRQPPKAIAQLIVLVLWGLVPFSWLYVLAFVGIRAYYARSMVELVHFLFMARLPSSWGLRPRIARLLGQRRLFVWALLETVFSTYYWVLVCRIQARQASSHVTRQLAMRAISSSLMEGLDEQARAQIVHTNEKEEMPSMATPLPYNDPRAVKFRHEMAGWFLGVAPEQISRRDVQEWLAWSIFGRVYAEMLHDTSDQDKVRMVEHTVELFAARRGLPFPEEVQLSPLEAKRKRVMLLTLDPVHVHTRPLLLYAGTYLLNRAALGVLHTLGLQRRWIGSLPYLVYIPDDWTPEKSARGQVPLPAVLLHGLGFGVIQYAPVIYGMLCPDGRRASRPLLVPLQPWMSYDFFSPHFLRPWKSQEACTACMQMLQRHGFDQCGVSILSHSMGTILHTWLLRAWGPSVVRRSLFVDPVCFQLWAPHICYRFLYKPTDSFVEYVLRYFVARELGTANLLMRHFDWSANVLLADEMPHREYNLLRIYLGGADTVVKASSVIQSLSSAGLEDLIVHRPTYHHGEFLLGPQNILPDIVRTLDLPIK